MPDQPASLLATRLSPLATRFLLLAFVVAAAALPAQSAPTVIVVVRHAEKAAAPASDPPLTEAGAERARALAATLAGARVQAVITTEYARSRLTAAPTADDAGVMPEIVRTGGPAALHARAVADAARKHVGKTVLVVGHSNTVTQIVEALGGPKAKDLCDSEYSWIWTVVLDGGPPRVMRSTFGAPSPAAPTGCSNTMMQQPHD